MSSRFYLLLSACLLTSSAAPAQEYHISGPYTHENLSIFLLHSSRRPATEKLLTLQEAMQQKKVVVYETGRVGELYAENRSSDDVFIQSGDIVKGGWQDRVLKEDFLLPSKSGKVPISSFCVEHGRWSRRGAETGGSFGASSNVIAGRPMKLAVRARADQAAVWHEVARMQARLADGLGAAMVSSPASPSSLQLTLENRELATAVEGYLRKLNSTPDGKPDVVGYAFAINGVLNSADVYSSNDLFRGMWPRLLKASAEEAVAERHGKPAAHAADAAAVQALLAEAGRGRSTIRRSGQLEIIRQDTDKELLFESRYPGLKGGWIHRSYIAQ